MRIIRSQRGRVAVRMELVIRCEYGSIIPWVRRLDDGRLTTVAGPDRLTLSTPAAVDGENLRTIAEFETSAGEEIPFSLTWSPSYQALQMSVMRAYLAERCEFGPAHLVEKDVLHADHSAWRAAVGLHPVDKVWFGRHLRAAYPKVGHYRPDRRSYEAHRRQLYRGLRLLTP
ncbi:MAG TPA: hypothetical protein VGI28_02145 [Stellaceae bacterium]